MLQNLLPQCGGVNVGIDFGGAYGLVAEHGLDGAKVGTAFKQGRSKRVAQRVGRDGLLDTRLNGLLLDHDKNHGARQVSTPAVQEHVVLLARFNGHVAAIVEPET